MKEGFLASQQKATQITLKSNNVRSVISFSFPLVSCLLSLSLLSLLAIDGSKKARRDYACHIPIYETGKSALVLFLKVGFFPTEKSVLVRVLLIKCFLSRCLEMKLSFEITLKVFFFRRPSIFYCYLLYLSPLFIRLVLVCVFVFLFSSESWTISSCDTPLPPPSPTACTSPSPSRSHAPHTAEWPRQTRPDRRDP